MYDYIDNLREIKRQMSLPNYHLDYEIVTERAVTRLFLFEQVPCTKHSLKGNCLIITFLIDG
jgi:hypothetical protein